MKITMYELLGLINDNQAPKRIKISELIYDFDDESQMYFDEEANELSDNIYLTKNLNHPVEILNEILEEEKKIPEKIDDVVFLSNHSHRWTEEEKVIVRTVNEIIDYLDYLKSKGE